MNAKAAKAIRQQIKGLGTATVPVEVWIDTRHLTRQIRYQAPIPAVGPAGLAAAARRC